MARPPHGRDSTTASGASAEIPAKARRNAAVVNVVRNVGRTNEADRANGRVIKDREELQQLLADTERRFLDRAPECPPHWGGYRLLAERIEFWQGRSSRLHDRLNYRLQGDAWLRERLAP